MSYIFNYKENEDFVVSTGARRKWPLLWIVHNWKCPAENPCWLNDIMTLAQLQSSCLCFRVSDGGGQRRKERRHPPPLYHGGDFLYCSCLFDWVALSSLWPSSSCTLPFPQGHMIFLRSNLWPPTTCHLRFPWRHMSSGPVWHLGRLFLSAWPQPVPA